MNIHKISFHSWCVALLQT